MNWTKEKIVTLSAMERNTLWENAKRMGRDDLVQMIEESGLTYRDPTGLKLDSPIGRAMAKIVNSPEGIAAAIKATEEGLPALAGIDPLLKPALMDQYAKTYEATIQAGYLVAVMMRKKGYENTGRTGPLTGCIAKSGEIYTLAP